MERNGEEVAIGIDLGLNSSSVAVCHYDRVEIILNDMGNRTTPPYVAFSETHCFVGDAAKSQAATNPFNTIFDSRRLLGRKFDDQVVQRYIKHCPFKVIPSLGSFNDKKPIIIVTHKRENKELRVEEISAMILRKLKEVAETYLGTKVNNAVITVPASFNYLQRQATKDAGVIAGLDVIQIIDESVAAAIAYGLDNKSAASKRNVLVLNLGRETCEISLVKIENKVFELESNCTDDSLGGKNFDNRLVDYFVDDFKRKYGYNISQNPRAMNMLRAACETPKAVLSSTSETAIGIDCLYNGIDYNTHLTRALFNKLNHDLLAHCVNLVDKCLKDAKMERENVHDVVLVGEASKIPMIPQMLEELFGVEVCNGIHPDEVVACGAALHAAVILRARPVDSTNIPSLLKDVDSLLKGFGGSKHMEPSLPSHMKAKVVEMLGRLKLDYSDILLMRNLSSMLRKIEISLPEHQRPALKGLEHALVACQSQFLEIKAENKTTSLDPQLVASVNADLTASKKKVQTKSSYCTKLKADIADINSMITRLMDQRASLEQDLDAAQLDLVSLTVSLSSQMELAKKRLNWVASFQDAEKSLRASIDCLGSFLTSL